MVIFHCFNIGELNLLYCFLMTEYTCTIYIILLLSINDQAFLLVYSCTLSLKPVHWQPVSSHQFPIHPFKLPYGKGFGLPYILIKCSQAMECAAFKVHYLNYLSYLTYPSAERYVLSVQTMFLCLSTFVCVCLASISFLVSV